MLQALAVMEEQQGNKEAAMSLLERALKQDPLDAPSWQASALRSSLVPISLHCVTLTRGWDCSIADETRVFETAETSNLSCS